MVKSLQRWLPLAPFIPRWTEAMLGKAPDEYADWTLGIDPPKPAATAVIIGCVSRFRSRMIQRTAFGLQRSVT